MKRALLRAWWFMGGCIAAYGVVLIVVGTIAFKIGATMHEWEETP